MKHSLMASRISVAAVCCMSSVGFATTMDFQSVPVGTNYGGDFGNVPGQTVLTENGIKMSVEQFFFQQYTGFFQAQVTGPANDHELALDNINVAFDLTGLPFHVSSLTLEYLELGGEDNFAVNGGAIRQLAQFPDLPTNVAPGVTALVDGGLIRLTGDIDRVLIGGQELSIDTVVAVPEPTSLLLVGAGAVAVLRRVRRTSRSARPTLR